MILFVWLGVILSGLRRQRKWIWRQIYFAQWLERIWALLCRIFMSFVNLPKKKGWMKSSLNWVIAPLHGTTSLIELIKPAVEPFQLWRSYWHPPPWHRVESSAKCNSPSLFLVIHPSCSEGIHLGCTTASISDLPRGIGRNASSSVVAP